MNRFSYRDELLRNAEAVGKFYQGVVTNWTDKLLREYKYKQALSEDTILHLEKIVRGKLTGVDRNHNKLFSSFLLKRESSRTECELQGELEQFQLPTPLKATYKEQEIQQTAVKTQQARSVADHQEEEYVDDLAEFQTPQQQKIEVKVQNTAAVQAKQQEQQRERSEGSSQSDYNDQIEEKIGSAILGTFCSFHIKRKPKEQKIFLDLQNVFVKYSNSPFENFHTKIACELTKIEKEDIKQLQK